MSKAELGRVSGMFDPVESLAVEEVFRPVYEKLDPVRTPAVEVDEFRRAIEILNPAEVVAGADEFRRVLEVLDPVGSLAVWLAFQRVIELINLFESLEVGDEGRCTVEMLSLGIVLAVEDEFR